MPIAPSEKPGLQLAVVDLTPAQIATLHSSPVTIVPQPGANGAIFPVAAVAQYDPGTVAYAGTAALALVVGSGTPFAGPDLGLNTLTDAVATFATEAASSVVVANQPLTVSAASDPGAVGGIATSSLAAAGDLWVPGDTATVAGGTGGVVTVSTVTNSFAISAVNQGAKTITVVGDASAIVATNSLTIYRSTGNDDTGYTAVSAVFSAGHTVVTIVEAIPSAVADGRLGDATTGAVGAIATYAVSTLGSGYVPGAESLTAVSPSIGESAQITILTTTIQSNGTIRLTVLYSTAALA